MEFSRLARNLLSLRVWHVSFIWQVGGLVENIQLVHKLLCDFEGCQYLIEVFSRSNGNHFARTVFSPEDVIISDGLTLEDALLKQQELLPLAILSRQMYFSSRLIN